MELIVKKNYVKIMQSFVITKVISGRLFLGNFILIPNILSLMVSWHFNKSIGWAIFHYIFGFWNLIYNLLSYRFANGGFMEIINSYF